MKRHEKMTAPRLLEAVYKRPGKPPRVKMIVGTREAIESMVGGPFDWTPISLEDDGRENVALYNTEAWRTGAEENSRPIPCAGAGRRGALRCDRPARGMQDARRPEGRGRSENPCLRYFS